MSDVALVVYKCTEIYRPEAEHGVRRDDPQIGIEWPAGEPLLSEKDRRSPLLNEIPPAELPTYPA